MNKKTKQNKKDIELKKQTMKPVIIGFLSIVVIVFALMMYKYKIDYNEFAKNNTFVQEKRWKKVKHNWPEPPEEMRIYVGDDFYFFVYKYDGDNFWIRANDSDLKHARSIFRYDTSTPSEISDESRVLEIGGNSSRYIYEYMKGLKNRMN